LQTKYSAITGNSDASILSTATNIHGSRQSQASYRNGEYMRIWMVYA